MRLCILYFRNSYTLDSKFSHYFSYLYVLEWYEQNNFNNVNNLTLINTEVYSHKMQQVYKYKLQKVVG